MGPRVNRYIGRFLEVPQFRSNRSADTKPVPGVWMWSIGNGINLQIEEIYTGTPKQTSCKRISGARPNRWHVVRMWR